MEDTKKSDNNAVVVVFSIYQFRRRQILWAFTQMGLSFRFLNSKHLRFGYMLGTGSGRGFSIWPNWQRYATLTVHTNLEEAKVYLQTNNFTKKLQNRSITTQRYVLQPVQSHGNWGGKNPFCPLAEPFNPSEKVGVLTRATIRFAKLYDFWRHVPAVSQSTAEAPGLAYQLGIGEWPIVQQATFSLWENEEAVKNFAYRMQQHKQVVSRTRQRQWYSEELFARFRILDSEVVS
jgi:hypothetical protein